MSWQRFNRGTNVFEVSDDNGASWQVLKIAAGGLALGSNIAYTNVSNPWSVAQFLVTNSAIYGGNAILQFIDPSLNYHRFVSYGAHDFRLEELALDGSAVIDNLLRFGSGQVYLGVVNGVRFISTSNGNNLLDLTCGPTNFTAGVTITGGALDAQVGTAVCRQGLRVSLDPPHPSALEAWYVVSSNHVQAAGGYYERARAAALGVWTDFTPGVSGNGGTVTLGTVYASSYMFIGKTLFLNVYLVVTITGSPTVVYFALPAGAVPVGYSANGFGINLGADITLMAQTSPGFPYLNIYRDFTGSMPYTAGTNVINGMAIIPIQ